MKLRQFLFAKDERSARHPLSLESPFNLEPLRSREWFLAWGDGVAFISVPGIRFVRKQGRGRGGAGW